MSSVFIANVSERDIDVNREDIPDTLDALCEMIMQNNWKDWRSWKKDISLPIIGKALSRIIHMDMKVSAVILFATDCGDVQDTKLIAEIIERYIIQEDNHISRDMVEIVPIRQSPDDYDVMMAFYESRLAQLKQHDRVYIEVTGGTPAMAFAMLWQAVEIFQERVQPIYISTRSNIPSFLNIGQKLRFEAVADDYKDMIEIYQYHAALNVLESHEDLCRKIWLYFDVLKSLTTYARQRINFNFEDAERSLWGVEQNLPQPLKGRVIELANEMNSRDHTWLLREEFLALEIDLFNGAYRDALSNIYAFVEGVMRCYVVKLGVDLTEDNRIEQSWLNANPKVKSYLLRRNINNQTTLMRSDFLYLLNFLSNDDPGVSSLLTRVDRLNKLVNLRHASTHQHAGVSKQQLEDNYRGGIEGFSHELKEIYSDVTDQVIGRNTFTVINELIADLVKIQV